MKQLTETQKAYTAGFIDGEGCISITRDKNSHNTTFRVTNTNKAVLEYLCEITGVGYIRKFIPSKTNRRAERFKNTQTQWAWQTSANGIRELLPEILPYLIVKQEVALTALELLKDKLPRGLSSTPEEHARRAPLYDKIKKLNHRGTGHEHVSI